MDRYAYGGHPIFIADRGFSGYNVFAHAIENKIDFMIHAKDLNVQRLPDEYEQKVSKLRI